MDQLGSGRGGSCWERPRRSGVEVWRPCPDGLGPGWGHSFTREKGPSGRDAFQRNGYQTVGNVTE